MDDKRFAHVLSDPKFRKIPKTERKVKIDDRFKVMFTGKQFKANYTVDKRGRPVKKTSTEDLKRYYRVSSGESESDNEAEEKTKVEKSQVSGDIKKKLKNLNVDYARGECSLFSESSSDDSGEEEEVEIDENDLDHNWGELDKDVDRTDEITSRLAACNMNWDRIRAVDLLVLFNSFLPAGGMIKSVQIYPSEFGLQRMKEEEVKGPIELVESKEGEEENEEGAKYHMEKLRKYQLNRLKYYYAVIAFDSTNSANKIYTECEGMEYESSATKLDLRFIPEDMEFEHEPKETCTQLPDMSKYQPRFFTTTALQQAKVDLTWDETDPDRLELAQKLSKNKLEEIDNSELEKFVAMSSESESDQDEVENSEEENVSDNENSNEEQSSDGESIEKRHKNNKKEKDKKTNLGKKNNKEEVIQEVNGNTTEKVGKKSKKKDQNEIDKYRALLLNFENEEDSDKNDVEMEFEWKPEQKEKAEQLVKEKLAKNEEDKNPFEKYLEKRKEKRKEKKKLKKNKEDDDDFPSDIDMNDPYFAEEFNKDEFKPKKDKKNNKNAREDSSENEESKKQLELLLLDEDESDVKQRHFSLEKIQKQEKMGNKKKNKKNKKLQEAMENAKDDFQIDVKDDRFSALFTSHQYNIDPTDPQFKKTKNMQRIIDEKLKRKSEVEDINEEINPAKRSKAELSALVKSVKNKAQSFVSKK